MSRNYKFYNPNGLYFVSFSVVNWLPVFTRKVYIDIFLKSLRFSQKHKGMEITAWCIMPDHIHLVFRSVFGKRPEQLLGDLKRYTSREIVKAIILNHHEKEKRLFLNTFSTAAKKSSNVKHYQFWQHHNHPIELWSNKVIYEKINYVHNNPVKAGLVYKAEDYPYSSAKDYSGIGGLLENIVIFKFYGGR